MEKRIPTQPETSFNKCRPTCINCGRELVFARIDLPPHSFNVFLCDCFPQPKGIAQDIVLAREWDDWKLDYRIEPDDCEDDNGEKSA